MAHSRSMNWRALVVLAIAASLAGCDLSDSPVPLPSSVPSALTFSVSPTTSLFSGSIIQLTARVTDQNGVPKAGTLVHFLTFGGSGTIQTNSFGEAVAQLGADRDQTFTASVDGIGTRSVFVPSVAPFTMTIALATTPAYVGLAPVMITVTPAAGIVGVPGLASVTVHCGGASTRLTAGWGDTRHTCTFATAGTHNVTATGIAAGGWISVLGSSVTVLPAITSPPIETPAPTPAVNFSASEIERDDVKAKWRFTAIPAFGTFESAEWDFGPGADLGTTYRTDNRTVEVWYDRDGSKLISLIAYVNGKRVTATRRITVEFEDD